MGIPLYSSNLAVVVGDRVEAAAVGDPSTGELVVAERGRGAWSVHHGTRRRVTTSEASGAIIVEPGRCKGRRREEAAGFTGDALRADRWDVLSLDTTLSLAYVAAGRAGAYVLFAGTAVHVAAGTLLVAEARGVVTDLAGSPWSVQSESVVASASVELHETLLGMYLASAGGDAVPR